ncbi:low molecular weight protein-tyrosine-phosphatase [Xenophilus sp. Marseille-Q4582]|uniref:low molecular weight protein-tyrosine-phosphatase n=1 Tax=Xenophilus sp. Marseille-Q4582 TaxID=2866600 RepID=UPI001CE44EFF|nr:low molecular weight protein-tyrosine-phosphatase [Xenophilus sp. Marseille-Q4582]
MTAASAGSGPVPRVLFICTGNICRSPTAHALLVHRAAEAGLAVQVDSAAISDEERGNPFDTRAAAELRRRGVPLHAHCARQVTRADFGQFDWVLGMTRAHEAALHRLAPAGHAARIALLLDLVPGREGQDVPDPWYGDARAFVQAFDLIEGGVQGLLAQLRGTGR